MKKQLLISGAIIIALSSLTGCGQNNANTTNTIDTTTEAITENNQDSATQPASITTDSEAPVETSNQTNNSSTTTDSETTIATSKPAETASDETNYSLTYNDNPGNRKIRIKFDRGATSKTVEDAVVRGTRDIYLLGANKGQQMNVNITSLEDNAVFDVISPSGQILERETKNWSGKLPQNGDYQIVVGGTRGNAT